MSKRRMELLREAVNEMICSNHHDREELVNISQELDELILEVIKENSYAKSVLGNKFIGEFHVVVDKIQAFEKAYDYMRIVDPVKKEVLELSEDRLSKVESLCHSFRNEQKICENCVSIRACNEDDVILKIEKGSNKVYMIIAVPVSIQGKKLAVELFKDISRDLHFYGDVVENKQRIVSLIEYKNQQTIKDELTNTYNRGYIKEKLSVNLLQASLTNEPFSIIFTDLNYHKEIHDLYGSAASDKALIAFAKELEKHICMEKDWIARIEEEKFIICLPDTDIDTAQLLGEKITKDLSQRIINIDNKQLCLSANLKVRTFNSNDNKYEVEDIIKVIDNNLF